MADAGSKIFNQKAVEKLRNPDDLDKYVRLTNPSVWVVLAACVALLLGLLAWGFWGTVVTSVNTKGVVLEDKAICFLSADTAPDVEVGDTANVDGKQMKVAEVQAVPLSRDEAAQVLSNDYLVSTLVQDDWVYLVTFDGDTSELNSDVPLPVNITTDLISPISLIMAHTPQ